MFRFVYKRSHLLLSHFSHLRCLTFGRNFLLLTELACIQYLSPFLVQNCILPPIPAPCQPCHHLAGGEEVHQVIPVDPGYRWHCTHLSKLHKSRGSWGPGPGVLLPEPGGRRTPASPGAAPPAWRTRPGRGWSCQQGRYPRKHNAPASGQ